MDGAARVQELVEASERIVVLTGAGISTDSGIPDFRGPNGIWTKNPRAERMSDLAHYLGDGEVRKSAWRTRLRSPVWGARPNAAHAALVELERRGKLLALITQNTDGLHQAAGSDPALVVEVHGTMHWTRCWSCGDRRPMAEVLGRVRAGEQDPGCEAGGAEGRECGGVLKSDTVSFGQQLDPQDLWRMQDCASNCDLLLAVGSSLTVHPAASVVPVASSSGADVVILNAEPTPYDDLATVVLDGPVGITLPAVVAEH